MPDLRELLKKYMQYVEDCEGANFVTDLDRRYTSEVKFTDEEWSLLKTISAEINMTNVDS